MLSNILISTAGALFCEALLKQNKHRFPTQLAQFRAGALGTSIVLYLGRSVIERFNPFTSFFLGWNRYVVILVSLCFQSS